MSLIDEMMDECVFMNKSKVSDGEGGFTTTWEEGAPIHVAIVRDTSMNARVAEKEGVTNIYTLTTSKANSLEYHDVIKRVADGLILRVTNDALEFPKVSSDLINNYSQVNAEKWELTS